MKDVVGWALLLCAPLAAGAQEVPVLVPQVGHWREVRQLAFSPDGRILASGSSDRTVILWDAATMAKRRTLADYAGGARICFAADGRAIHSIGADGAVTRWDVATGQEQKPMGRSAARLTCINCSEDGELLAAGGADGSILVWARTGRSEQTRWSAHSQPVAGLSFSPDGSLLVTGDTSGELRVWRASDGGLLRSLAKASEPRWPTGCIAFSPDARSVVVGGGYNMGEGHTCREVKAYAPLSGAMLWSRFDVGDENGCISWSPDGRSIAVADLGERVSVLDAATGASVSARLPVCQAAAVTHSTDGRTVAIGSVDGSVLCCDAATGKCSATGLPGTRVARLAVSADRPRLAMGAAGSKAVVWDVSSWAPPREIRVAGYGEAMPVYSPDGTAIAITPEFGDGVYVYDTSTCRVVTKLGVDGWHHGHVVYSPDGGSVAQTDGTAVRVWGTAHGELQRLLLARHGAVRSLAYSPDGRTLAAGAEDGSVVFWDIGTARGLQWLSVGVQVVTGLAYTSGRTVASACGSGVTLVDVVSGMAVRHLVGHTGAALSVAAGAGGRLVVSGGAEGSAILWETATGERLRTFAGHNCGVESVAFGPGPRVLATAAGGPARFWQIDTGQLLATVFLLGACPRIASARPGIDKPRPM